ncbi:MAG: uracil-DNA glycosylase [Flavobacteriaceae bacterium]
MSSETEPGRDCPLCPRLAEFRAEQRVNWPGWHNAPVPSFGAPRPRLLVVGLAPGLKGANRTGRPFTGDYAGDLLYATLKKFGFAAGEYRADPADGLTLHDCLITNAVRCVPPQNKPTPAEIRACNPFLGATLEASRPPAVLALGRIAHDAVLDALGEKRSRHRFAHGARHETGGAALFDSYHCSRYNTNTGRLTTAMFEDVFAAIDAYLAA